MTVDAARIQAWAREGHSLRDIAKMAQISTANGEQAISSAQFVSVCALKVLPKVLSEKSEATPCGPAVSTAHNTMAVIAETPHLFNCFGKFSLLPCV